MAGRQPFEVVVRLAQLVARVDPAACATPPFAEAAPYAREVEGVVIGVLFERLEER